MQIRYGIEDINKETLTAIDKKIQSNKGFIFSDDIKFFFGNKLPLQVGTVGKIMTALYGKESFDWSVYYTGPNYCNSIIVVKKYQSQNKHTDYSNFIREHDYSSEWSKIKRI